MGAVLLGGLALAGAAIGIAQATAGVRGGAGAAAPAIRGTAIVGFAFAQGVGVVGSVVALLAILVREAGDASTGIVETVIAGAGAVVGLAIVARAGDGPRSTIRVMGLLYILSSAALGTSIGLLAAILGQGAAVGWDAIFVILGVVALAAAVAIGRVTAAALMAIATNPSDAVDIRRGFLRRVTFGQAVGTLAMAAAIVLLFVGESSRPG